jgi:hypothetical protein
MTNGDRFTGEVKSLSNGVLYLKTDYVAENIGVDWAQVQNVESSAVFQVTLVNGVHLIGKIKRQSPDKPKSREEFLIETNSGTTRVPASNVAEIATQKPSVWRQLSGRVATTAWYHHPRSRSFQCGKRFDARNRLRLFSFPRGSGSRFAASPLKKLLVFLAL